MDLNTYETFKFERRGNILTAIINRPEQMNAVNAQMHTEMASVFYDLQKDPDSDVIVLTGEGRAFCAGGDTAWFQKMIDDPVLFERLMPEAKAIVFGLLELENPLICRLNGAAAGLGATIALLCDIVIASEKALIGDPHVCMGLVAGDGGCVIWPQLIGFARAKEYLMTGELLPATKAAEIGLINYALLAEELDGAVDAFAERLLKGATKAIRWSKTVTNIELKRIVHQVMDASVAYEALSNRTADHQEAVAAFRAKRTPTFTGG